MQLKEPKVTLKQWCLDTAEKYRNKHMNMISWDEGPIGICKAIDNDSYYIAYKIDFKPLNHDISLLPVVQQHRRFGPYKFSIEEKGFEERAQFLEKFTQTLED